jgi:nucleotide-binding universal stress UspA family protein
MTFTSVLVHVEAGSPSSDARVELAADIAERFQALLIGVAAGEPAPVPAEAYGAGSVVADLLVEEDEQIKRELAAAEERFRAISGAHGVALEWRSATAVPADFIVREARSADLVVVGRDLARAQAGMYRAADPGDVLMVAGRPVLVVPPGTNSLKADHVLVAWKDSREARRAVVDALPFLAKAQTVSLLEVAEEADRESAAARTDRVASFLERHGVNARPEARTQRERSAADELILAAEQRQADLIVAGGYGHARLREWAFGGVTRDLLKRSPKCCLLSH